MAPGGGPRLITLASWLEDLGELAATNQAQAASIEAAGTISPERRRLGETRSPGFLTGSEGGCFGGLK